MFLCGDGRLIAPLPRKVQATVLYKFVLNKDGNKPHWPSLNVWYCITSFRTSIFFYRYLFESTLSGLSFCSQRDKVTGQTFRSPRKRTLEPRQSLHRLRISSHIYHCGNVISNQTKSLVSAMQMIRLVEFDETYRNALIFICYLLCSSICLPSSKYLGARFLTRWILLCHGENTLDNHTNQYQRRELVDIHPYVRFYRKFLLIDFNSSICTHSSLTVYIANLSPNPIFPSPKLMWIYSVSNSFNGYFTLIIISHD